MILNDINEKAVFECWATLIVLLSLDAPPVSLVRHISPPPMSNIADFHSCHFFLLSEQQCTVWHRWQWLLRSCVSLLHFYAPPPFLSVHAAGAKVKVLEDEADRLLEKLEPIKKLQDNLRRNISQIKELINQARKQANSVSFQPSVQLPAFNGV